MQKYGMPRMILGGGRGDITELRTRKISAVTKPFKYRSQAYIRGRERERERERKREIPHFPDWNAKVDEEEKKRRENVPAEKTRARRVARRRRWQIMLRASDVLKNVGRRP